MNGENAEEATDAPADEVYETSETPEEADETPAEDDDSDI